MLIAITLGILAGGLFLLFVWYLIKDAKSLPEIGTIVSSNVKPRDPRDVSAHHFTGPDIYMLKPTDDYVKTQPEFFVNLLEERGYRLATLSEYDRNKDKFVFSVCDYSNLIIGVHGTSNRVYRRDLNHLRPADSQPLYVITRERAGIAKEAA